MSGRLSASEANPQAPGAVELDRPGDHGVRVERGRILGRVAVPQRSSQAFVNATDR